MAELPQKKTLTIFLASPGDLQEERRRAREVVDELNSSLGRELDTFVDLLGWEDTLPGYGRPQEQINRDLDKCQLFIGILWKRWGTPPGETYSSGFEEEYERALARRSQTGEPEIWLAFKKIDRDQLQDPGEQLKRVITFRQSQEASRTVFFKEFLDQNDWEKQLRGWLQTHIVNLYKKGLDSLRQPSPNEIVPSPPAVSTEPQEAFENTRGSRLPTQLTEAIAELHHGVMSGDLQSYTQTLASLPRASATRLFLALKAAITARFSAEALSTHEINLLYRDRSSIDPLPAEIILFLRTMLADQHSLNPGWYWFCDVNDDVMLEDILYVIKWEFTFEKRVSALALLVDLAIPLPEDDALAHLLETTEESVLRQLVRWIGAVGVSRHLSVLDAIEQRLNTMSSAVFDAKTLITAREEPERALQLITDRANHPTGLLPLLERQADALSSDLLAAALKSPSQATRLFAARLLEQRGQLSTALAQDLCTDPFVKVREVAVRTLIEKGVVASSAEIQKIFKEPPPVVQSNPFNLGFGTAQTYFPEDSIDFLFTKQPLTQLIETIDWYSLEGCIAYRVAATQHFAQFGARVKQDLKNNFQSVRQRSFARFQEQYGREIAEKIDEPWTQLNDFVRNRFTAAAMAGIALHGSTEDVVLARVYLTPNWKNLPPELQINVARILKRFGNREDVEYLFALTTQSYGEAQKEVVQAILALAPEIETARRLAESDDLTLVRIGLRDLMQYEWDAVWPTVQRLLRHKQDQIRLAAVAFCCNKREREELASLLDEYVSLPSYYYNVVCWLDRILFAPGLFGNRFRARLEQMISSTES